jgi:hypothetical protein
MLAVVVGIMPLVVRMITMPLPQDVHHIYLPVHHPHGYQEFFNQWKGFFTLIPAAVISFLALSEWTTAGKMPDWKSWLKSPPIAASIGFMFFTLLSTIFSSYTHIAIWGMMDRGEGLLIWGAYFVLFLGAMFHGQSDRNMRIIMYSFAFSSILMGAVGVSQLIGRDFFETEMAGWLVTGYAGALNTRFTIAHGTLFNPNTFGKYTAFASPVLLLAAITWQGKWYGRIILGAGGVLMLTGVVASGSLAGFVGLAAAVGVVVVTLAATAVYRAVTRGSMRVVAHVGGALLVIIIAAGVVASFVPQFEGSVERLRSRFSRFEAGAGATAHLQNYTFSGNTLRVHREGETILTAEVHSLRLDDDNWITVRCSEGEVVPIRSVTRGENGEPSSFRFRVPGYRDVIFDLAQGFFVYNLRGRRAYFLTLEDDVIMGLTPAMNLIDLENPAPAWGFYGRERWGSSRGFIWSRTFPLLPSRTILGSGPDTFVLTFPLFDIVANHRYMHDPYRITDKAHNFFLHTWVGNGGIAAILLFGIFFHYMLTTFISLIRSKNEALASYGLRLGLLAGIAAFSLSSMSTDSTIGSTGVFFVLLGLGYAVNEKARQNTEPLTA